MKTKLTAVSFTASIWALPTNEYQRNECGMEPFEYAVYAGYNAPWQSGAVKLHEVEMQAHLPEGLDLLGKAVETLELAITEENERHESAIKELNRAVAGLMLLEHQA